MAIDLKALLKERIEETAALWAKDLAAHRDDQLITRPSETARSLADIAWETITINRRVATRLRGETPGPIDGFPVCPPEMANRVALAEQMAASAQEILAAAGDSMEREIPLPNGEKESVFSYGEFALMHMQYHLGQLNYVQTVYGDTDIHWR